MNKNLVLLAAIAAAAVGVAQFAYADPVSDKLVIDGKEMITRAPAPEGHPFKEVLSGWLFRESETRALEFLATVAQTGTTVQVELVAHVPGVPSTTFSGTVSGQTINFPNFSFNQTMGRGAALAASGSANVATNGLSITGTLNGTYQTSSGASCNATNHQLQLVKLCLQPTATGTAMLPCQ